MQECAYRTCRSSCRDGGLVALLRARANFVDGIKVDATTGERHATITGQSTTLDNIPYSVELDLTQIFHEAD